MLRVQLHINREQIGDYEVRNVTPDPKHRRLHNYEVRAIDDAWRVDSKPLCVVRHRREDGAERLAAKVLMRMAEIHEED